eukprot:9679470-Alexandrium_andersonii.AAC.1
MQAPSVCAHASSRGTGVAPRAWAKCNGQSVCTIAMLPREGGCAKGLGSALMPRATLPRATAQ